MERVFLLDTSTLGLGLTLSSTDNALDFRGVDETAQVWLDDNWGWEEEVLLEGRRLGGGTVDGIEGLECSRGPDDETTEVTTWGELEEVEGEDGAGLDTWDVAESSDELLAINGWVVDNQWSTALTVAAATELTLTSAELAGGLDLLDVLGGAYTLEEVDSSGSLGDGGVGEDLRVDNERNFWDLGDLVTTGKEESRDGGGSQGRGSSKSLLAKVDLDIPASPGLGGSEHATRSAHVTESSLTSTVSSTTRDTRDTGNSTTCKSKIISHYPQPQKYLISTPVPKSLQRSTTLPIQSNSQPDVPTHEENKAY